MGACDVTVIIVDLEASSLLPGTFPIEVAWVFEDGSGEAHLIRPVAEWLDPARDNPGWSAQGEKIHGISLETLLKDGEPAEVVARRAAAVLADQTVVVCSDSPPMDELWLQRLFEAGGIRQRVSIVDVERLYGWACRPLQQLVPALDHPGRGAAEQRVSNLSREIADRAEEEERFRPGVRHRALPDALSLWRTRQSIMTKVQDYLTPTA